MDSGKDTNSRGRFLTTESSPLLQLNSDLLESIVQLLLDDAQSIYSDTSPFNTITRLSHVCTALRHVVISRRRFWISIRCNEDTRLDAVIAQLDRAGDMPLEIDMRTRVRGWEANKRYPIDNPEVFQVLFQQMPHAAKICIDVLSHGMTNFVDAAAGEPHTTPLPYAERPLQELELRATAVGDILQLIGPNCTTLVLSNLYISPLLVQDLEAALIDAPMLKSLTVEHIQFKDSGSVNSITTAGKGVTLRNQTLKELVLSEAEPLSAILPLALRLFPGTKLLTPTISIYERNFGSWEYPESIVQLLQLANLGTPEAVRVIEAGDQYQVDFPNGIAREFSLPEDFASHADQQSRNIIYRLLDLTPKLEIHDADTLFFGRWLESWHGSTWSSVTSLEIHLNHPDYTVKPTDHTIGNPPQRISLPTLKDITFTGRYDGYEDTWAAECAIVLDTFSFPNDVIVDLQDSDYRAEDIQDIQETVNQAYRDRTGRAYFPEREGENREEVKSDVDSSQD